MDSIITHFLLSYAMPSFHWSYNKIYSETFLVATPMLTQAALLIWLIEFNTI